MTDETGFKINFESAIVPQWRNGVIRLRNVSVTCNDKSWQEYNRSRHDGLTPFNVDDVDINWTYWNLKIECVDVTLSLAQWFEGRGLVRDCKIKGVSGDVHSFNIE